MNGRGTRLAVTPNPASACLVEDDGEESAFSGNRFSLSRSANQALSLPHAIRLTRSSRSFGNDAGDVQDSKERALET